MRILQVLMVASTCSAIAAVLGSTGITGDLRLAAEARSLDLRMSRYRGSVVPPGTSLDDVVIVDIDEASLAELGQYFRWPRAYHARIVETLHRAGARAIGFDVLFPEAERMPDEVALAYAQRLRPDAVEETRRLLLALGGDADLGAAALGAGNVTFGAQVVGTGSTRRLVAPVSDIAAGADGLGHVQLAPDDDGIVRRVPAALHASGRWIPSLAVHLALQASGLPAAPLELNDDGLRGPGWHLPTDADGAILVDFLGPPGTFLRVSFADVLRQRVPEVIFTDRVVLVGATASGLMDHLATPMAPHFPGVEIHATLIHNILAGRFIRPVSPAWDATLTWGLALTTAAAVLWLSPGLAAGLCLIALLCTTLLGAELFARDGLWLGLALPLGTGILSAASASGLRYWTEERSKLAIKRAFGHYLAPEVVEQISADPSALGLGGEERRITVGFSDIRDFTRLSEGLSAGQLAHLLNDYLSDMTRVIQDERGAVDKYIGDAIMMLFGAPNSLPDSALRACRAARQMVHLVRSQQSRWRAHGIDRLDIGIGINTGIASVGNMGSDVRFAYTAMGDAVNLASRLEGQTKLFGTPVVIGAETAADLGGALPLRELDRVRVKGRDRPVQIFELLCDDDAIDLTPTFEEGLDFVRRRRWSQARACFDECRRRRPQDGPTLYYLDLLDRFAQNPPPDDWDGVSTRDTK